MWERIEKVAFDLWRYVAQWNFVNESFRRVGRKELKDELDSIDAKMRAIVDEFDYMEDLIPIGTAWK